MKNIVITALALGSSTSIALSAQINATNFQAGGANINIVQDSTSVPIASGAGFVSIGTFTLAATDINSDNLGAVIADFQLFGTPGDFATSGAFSTAGLYNFAAAGSTAVGDAFVGNTIYTVVTDTNAVADASEVLVYEHDAAFDADGPLFTADTPMAAGSAGTLLIGTAGTANVPALGGDVASVQLIAVPEPSSMLLAGLGGLALIRRRR